MKVLLSFFQNVLILVKLHWVIRLQQAVILISPLSSAVLASRLAFLLLELGDDAVLPVLLLDLNGWYLKPASGIFLFT